VNRALAHLLLAGPLAALALGCDVSSVQNPTTIPSTPEVVLKPEAPDEEAAPKTSAPAPDESLAPTAAPAEAIVTPRGLAAPTTPAPTEPSPSATEAEDVTLTSMTFDEYLAKAVVKPQAKLVVVDAWATWCAPCKENFPHLVEMHRKYADQGLACVSLSLDDPTDDKAVAVVKAFLKAQNATFTNVLLNEEYGVGFDKFDVNGIPAVFLYDPSGKEIRRFTMDDPNRQFTYDQVDQVVAQLLKGETLAADAPGEVKQPGK
jgi:thiol-disulfide isomerase/thioredoxin